MKKERRRKLLVKSEVSYLHANIYQECSTEANEVTPIAMCLQPFKLIIYTQICT